MNIEFQKLLSDFKKQEDKLAENVIFIIDNIDLQKVIIAWGNTKVIIVEETIPRDKNISDWEYMWKYCRYSKTQFISLTGLESVTAVKYLNHLKDLKLLYPDGTINGIARKFIGGVLRNSINRATGQKEKKEESKPASKPEEKKPE